MSAGEFAVIETGGKQYQVKAGDVIKVEKLSGSEGKSLNIGDKVTFNHVLLVDNGKDTTIGNPYIEGAKVEASLQESGKDKKVLVVKYKQKSRYLKRNGHRQPFMRVKIEGIK